ncbi:hypothetical protein ACFWHE_35670, partial [Streptomyces hydrogenans]
MVWFLGLGIGGLLLLVLSLVFDGVLEGLFDGVGGLDERRAEEAVDALVRVPHEVCGERTLDLGGGRQV